VVALCTILELAALELQEQLQTARRKHKHEVCEGAQRPGGKQCVGDGTRTCTAYRWTDACHDLLFAGCKGRGSMLVDRVAWTRETDERKKRRQKGKIYEIVSVLYAYVLRCHMIGEVRCDDVTTRKGKGGMKRRLMFDW